MPHLQEMTTSEIQLGDIQDMICCGTCKETGIWWMVCGDGHGEGLVVTKARKYNWAALGELPSLDIQTIIAPFIDEVTRTSSYDDGMTCSIIRGRIDSVSHKTVVEVAWIGDSEIIIGQTSGPNHGTIFSNKGYKLHANHQDKVTFEETCNFEIVDDTLCRALRDRFYIFPTGNIFEPPVKINMTGALGHKGATTHPLFQKCFELDCNETFIIRVATDGLWQMLHRGDINDVLNPNVTSQDLAQIAETRWKRTDWNYDPNYEGTPIHMMQPISNNAGTPDSDDIAVGTIVIYPQPTKL